VQSCESLCKSCGTDEQGKRKFEVHLRTDHEERGSGKPEIILAAQIVLVLYAIFYGEGKCGRRDPMTSSQRESYRDCVDGPGRAAIVRESGSLLDAEIQRRGNA